MQTTDQIIEEAIDAVIGTPPPIGSVCAHRDDPVTRELMSVVDGIATLSYDGVTKRFPASEIFNPNDVKREALRIQLREASVEIAAAPNN